MYIHRERYIHNILIYIYIYIYIHTYIHTYTYVHTCIWALRNLTPDPRTVCGALPSFGASIINSCLNMNMFERKE